MSMPSLPELMIILVVILLMFGGSKLPKLGGAIGESIKNFKKGLKESETPDSKEIADKKDSSNKQA